MRLYRFFVRDSFFLFSARCLVVLARGLFCVAAFFAAVCCLSCLLPVRYYAMLRVVACSFGVIICLLYALIL